MEDVEQHVLKRFELCQKLGKGAYGVVWKAMEKKSGKIVALKKCFDAFRNDTDGQRTFREISYLQQLAGHENIIRLQHIIKGNDRDIYVTFDHMETDLHAVIRAGILEPIHKKYVVYQLLKALKFMHSGQLIHRDIKPSNLLLNSDCHLKVCDFGLCRSIAENAKENKNTLTDYVATRWYRAPEILLGSPMYTAGVDMWAVGCILSEMLTGKPLFPGTSTVNQIEQVISFTGYPTPKEIESIKSPYAATMLEQLAVRKSSATTPPTHSLIVSTITFDPTKRLSARTALEHDPFLADFKHSEDEPEYQGVVKIPLDDDTKLSAADYRNALYKQIIDLKKMKRASQ